MKQWRRAWRRIPQVLLVGLAGIVMSGCVNSRLATPYPDVVQAPHPRQPPEDWSAKELLEAYTASPNRDPDGLGLLPIFWAQSQATLVVEALARKWEQGNRIAFARDEQAQRAAEAKTGAYHRGNVVILTVLFTDIPPYADPSWFQPEGVYLLDDKGRKFIPERIDPDVVDIIYYYNVLSYYRTDFSNVGNPTLRFSRIVFPGRAVTGDTRALFLYFAAYQKRLRFAWVFDPTYEIESSDGQTEYGSGLNRIFR